MVKRYKVLGNEGDVVEVEGSEFVVGAGDVLELEDAVAEAAVAAGKVELIESTPEEVAEEDRRAALTQEERDAEDQAKRDAAAGEDIQG